MPIEKYKSNIIHTNPINKDNSDLDRFLSLVWYNSLPNEEWREIPFTQGKNFVSTEGRVASIRANKAIFLQPYVCGSGYYCVSIKYDGDDTYTDSRINRLVAKAFIPNPDNKIVVHHKDMNKKNNRVTNLEWMTIEEHCEAHKKIRENRKELTNNDE